jgi:SAM-dependent methyltransferase
MSELYRMLGVAGLRQLWRFRRARKWGWEGILRGHFMTRVLQTLLQLGVLDAMSNDTWIDARQFATANQFDPDVVVALCDYLFARRVLRKDGPRFTLDDDGKFLVGTDLLRGWFQLSEGYEPVLHRLGSLARREVNYGNGVVRDGELVASGSGLASSGLYFPLAADIIRRLVASNIVLDIGCGNGTFLRYLCRTLPGVRGIGLDLSPEAIAVGQRVLQEEGLTDRISLHQGNAMDIRRRNDFPADIDVATAFFVLHELVGQKDHARLTAFLREFRQALPRTTFVIVETIRPSAEKMRERPGPAIEYFLFHDLSRQVPIGRDQWQRVLKEAGFTSIEERYLSFARSAIYVVR